METQLKPGDIFQMASRRIAPDGPDSPITAEFAQRYQTLSMLADEMVRLCAKELQGLENAPLPANEDYLRPVASFGCDVYLSREDRTLPIDILSSRFLYSAACSIAERMRDHSQNQKLRFIKIPAGVDAQLEAVTVTAPDSISIRAIAYADMIRFQCALEAA